MRLAFSNQQEAVRAWLSRIQKCCRLNADWEVARAPKELNVYAAGNRIFAEGFVIYSYGTHFPMARWIPQQRAFTINLDRCSNSTSKHQSIVRKWVHQYATWGFKSPEGDVKPVPVFRLSISGIDELKHVWLPEFDCVEILEYYHRRIRDCVALARRATKHRQHYLDMGLGWITERNQFATTFRDRLLINGIEDCPELPEDVTSALVLLKLTQP